MDLPEASNKSVDSPTALPHPWFTLGPGEACGGGSVLHPLLPTTVALSEPPVCHLQVLNSAHIREHLLCAPHCRHPRRQAVPSLWYRGMASEKACGSQGHIVGPRQLDMTSALWDACSSHQTHSHTLPSSPCSPAHPMGPEVLDASLAGRTVWMPGARSSLEGRMGGSLHTMS